MKIAVVTGCLGFIGSHLTRRLLKNDWYVYGIDKGTYAANISYLNEFSSFSNFKFEKADIASLTWLPDCDFVINVAAESHVGNSIINSTEFISSNIVGVKNLLDLIRNKPVNTGPQPVFFHFSTDEVYGDILDGNFTEENLLNPSNVYAASKASADMLIKGWSRTYGIEYIIVRPTNNYGVGQYKEKLIPLAISNLKRGIKIRLHNHGKPTRTWLHVEDTVNAIILLLSKGQKNQIYNISGGDEKSNLEVATSIVDNFLSQQLSLSDVKEYFDFSYVREGQDIRYSLNDSKIRKLGWRPLKKFDEELKDIVDFYKNNHMW